MSLRQGALHLRLTRLLAHGQLFLRTVSLGFPQATLGDLLLDLMDFALALFDWFALLGDILLVVFVLRHLELVNIALLDLLRVVLEIILLFGVSVASSIVTVLMFVLHDQSAFIDHDYERLVLASLLVFRILTFVNILLFLVD